MHAKHVRRRFERDVCQDWRFTYVQRYQTTLRFFQNYLVLYGALAGSGCSSLGLFLSN